LFGLDKLFDELILSYSLLFGQTENGLKVLRSLISAPARIGPETKATEEETMMSCTETRTTEIAEVRVIAWETQFLRQFGASTIPPSLDDFLLFGGRLERLQLEMRDWRPRRFRDLFRPGYGDRFTWYTQMFALGVALLGTSGLFLASIGTAFTIRMYYDSLQLAQQSLGVALEALALQQQQMNLTAPG
jgi:hypothetical protein